MGIGPVPAARKALARAGLTLDEMDLVEVNEAFAAQYLAVEKELGLDPARTNVDGGAVAIGHPLARHGARITRTCCTRCGGAAGATAWAAPASGEARASPSSWRRSPRRKP